MKARFNYYQASPETMGTLFNTDKVIENTGLDHRLVELVKVRASQINGCAFCLHMHSAGARKAGISQAELDTLCAWREIDWFSEREKAALGWTEYLTCLSEQRDGDPFYEALNRHFTEKEQTDLTYVIGVINMWNRFGVGFKLHPE